MTADQQHEAKYEWEQHFNHEGDTYWFVRRRPEGGDLEDLELEYLNGLESSITALERENARLSSLVNHHAREQHQHEALLSRIMAVTGARTNRLLERLDAMKNAETENAGKDAEADVDANRRD